MSTSSLWQISLSYRDLPKLIHHNRSITNQYPCPVSISAIISCINRLVFLDPDVLHLHTAAIGARNLQVNSVPRRTPLIGPRKLIVCFCLHFLPSVIVLRARMHVKDGVVCIDDLQSKPPFRGSRGHGHCEPLVVFARCYSPLDIRRVLT